MTSDNPFATPSDLPFRLPPFDRIREEHYLPAFEAGMAEQRAELEAIATDPEPPSVANTLEALERSGRLLTRVGQVFFNLTSSSVTPGLTAIENEIAPRLAAHTDAIYLDRRLFARVDALEQQRDDLGLDADQRRLLDRYHKNFVRAGAGLDDARQDRLRQINADLARLTAAFKTDLLADTVERAVHVEDPARLAGLSHGAISAAAEAARHRGLSGHLLTLDLPSVQPALGSLLDRGLRERLYRASLARGNNPAGGHDTRGTLVRMVTLRAERAQLLGYPDHASYVIEDETAGSLGAVDELLSRVIGPAVVNARAEAGALLAELRRDHPDAVALEPWDWPFYAEVARARRGVDSTALRPHFPLRRVVEDGIFHAANALYGLGFVRRPDLVAYSEEVEVFEVRTEDGTPRGLFLADWYARDSKRGGAWMSSFVDQSHLHDDPPVILINLNLPHPADGEPTLLTLEEVETAFHEFGHVLHGLLSDVRYPMLSGTNVPRDFVEFPSQVNEMWAFWPPVLARYARHHVTGEPLAHELIDAVVASRTDGQGFATTEYLAAAVLDLAWHRLSFAEAAALTADDVEHFERDALERNGFDVAAIAPRYRSTYFAHIFAGEYSAGYYSYIWSEVLDADTVEWFREHEGLDREAGRRFAQHVLSRGGAVDPLEAFTAFRGRPPRIEPLLARRGLDQGSRTIGHRQ